MIVTLAIAIGVFMRITGIGLAALAASLWRPVLAAMAMAGVVLLVERVAPDIALPRLVMAMAAGGITYVAALLGLWWAAGRPATIEADLVSAAVAWFRATRSST
jgi:hypothetical protein